MPETLPRGWVETTLGEIAESSPERASPLEYPDMRYVGLEHVEPHSMRLLGYGLARDVRSSSARFSVGDILYGKMRPYLNKVWVAEFDGLCSAEFLVLKKHDGLNSQFLATRMNAEDFVTFANEQTTGERPRVSFEKLAHFRILLPPLAEQERIVSKLTASLSRLSRAEAAARRAQERLQRYRNAVLDAALTGELIHGLPRDAEPSENAAQLLERILGERRHLWEEVELKRLRAAGKETAGNAWKSAYPEPIEPETVGLPETPPGWTWASAEQLTEAIRPISYGVIKLGAQVDDGVPILRSSDVRPLRLELTRVKRIDRRIADEYKRTYLQGGEVLVTIRGTLGGVASVPAECAGYNISREVAMLALVEPRTSRTAAYFIAARPLQEWLSRRTRGIAYTGINIETLRALPIPVAPLSEQFQIVGEVDRRLSAANRLLATLEQQFARVSATRKLLLAEGFAGQLVTQYPDDEPATQLLKRVGTGRNAENQHRKGKPMPKPKLRTNFTNRPNLLSILEASSRPMTPEELFEASGYTQESVDEFFAELRQLTTVPARIVEERGPEAAPGLKALR